MPEPTKSSRRIMVVDDEPLVCDAVRMLLSLDGHKVETALSGELALGKFEPGKYDLIVLDYAMPVMKGDQLAATIRERAPQQPILMLTAHGEQVRASASAMKVIDLVLDKPFQLDTLRAGVADVLSRRSSAT
jgi:two-component system OmpR family response regulator/two-component system alkaline phosphatase synthesis response regulator PhoP